MDHYGIEIEETTATALITVISETVRNNYHVVVTGVMANKLANAFSLLPKSKLHVVGFSNTSLSVDVACYASIHEEPRRFKLVGEGAMIIEQEVREALHGGIAQRGCPIMSGKIH